MGLGYNGFASNIADLLVKGVWMGMTCCTNIQYSTGAMNTYTQGLFLVKSCIGNDVLVHYAACPIMRLGIVPSELRFLCCIFPRLYYHLLYLFSGKHCLAP